MLSAVCQDTSSLALSCLGCFLSRNTLSVVKLFESSFICISVKIKAVLLHADLEVLSPNMLNVANIFIAVLFVAVQDKRSLAQC